MIEWSIKPQFSFTYPLKGSTASLSLSPTRRLSPTNTSSTLSLIV